MKAYKFRGSSQIAFALDIILNQRLRCSDWKTLNDPMEGTFAYSHEKSNEEDVVDTVDRIIREKSRIKVCSLSRIFGSHLLWAHYGEGFSGVAIEIDLPDNHHSIKPVEYGGVFAWIDMKNPGTIDPTVAAQRVLLNKNKDWAYEKEVRILHDEEWYKLRKPVKRVIAGHRMNPALFHSLNIVCNSLGITLNRTGIGDEGIDADYVPPPDHLTNRSTRTLPL